MTKDEAVSRPRLWRALSDRAAWQIATGICLAGIALLYAAALWEDAKGPNAGDATLRELGALFVVTGAVSVLWDLRGRRVLTDEVLSAARLSAEVQEAGIRRFVKGYLGVDWESHFRTAREVDLFFGYAQTWRNSRATDLRRFVERDGARLRVILPDPDDGPLVGQLAAKFGIGAEELRRRIEGARTDFENLEQQACAGATVELRFTPEFPVYTYYRFDRVCVTALYAQAPGRTPDVPTFELDRGGALYQFFSQQFDELWAAATPSG